LGIVRLWENAYIIERARLSGPGGSYWRVKPALRSTYNVPRA
jgi:hypothetical protein